MVLQKTNKGRQKRIPRMILYRVTPKNKTHKHSVTLKQQSIIAMGSVFALNLFWVTSYLFMRKRYAKLCFTFQVNLLPWWSADHPTRAVKSQLTQYGALYFAACNGSCWIALGYFSKFYLGLESTRRWRHYEGNGLFDPAARANLFALNVLQIILLHVQRCEKC